MTRRRSAYLCALLSLLLARDASYATTVNTAYGNGMDSSLQEDYPTDTRGSSSELETIRNPGGGSRAFLVRFDLSEWVLGGYSGTATIELTNYRDQHDVHTVNVWGIADGSAGDTLVGLNEATVTWSNAPGLVPDGLPGDDEDLHPSNIHLGSFLDGSIEGAIDTLSNNELLDFLNGDTNGLVVLLFTTPSPDSHGQVWASKEATSFSYRPSGEFAAGTHAPRLTFTGTPVPEPTTPALVAVGIAFLARRNRPPAK